MFLKTPLKLNMFIILFLISTVVFAQHSINYTSNTNVAIVGDDSTSTDFFTTNNDTFNDVWKPLETSIDFNSNLELLIFNRYGKLLSKTTSLEGWNGQLDGLNLPSDDYWYIINHSNASNIKSILLW